MAKRKPIAQDRPAVTARAEQLKLLAQVPYWIVVSYQDGQELSEGRVPASIKAQVLNLLKREVEESQAAYIARISQGQVPA